MTCPPCVHYVGFRDDRYWNAYRLWGGPRMIHRRWDLRAQRDIGPDDLVVFAEGDETQPLSRYNGQDLDEEREDGRTYATRKALRATNV